MWGEGVCGGEGVWGRVCVGGRCVRGRVCEGGGCVWGRVCAVEEWRNRKEIYSKKRENQRNILNLMFINRKFSNS